MLELGLVDVWEAMCRLWSEMMEFMQMSRVVSIEVRGIATYVQDIVDYLEPAEKNNEAEKVAEEMTEETSIGGGRV